MNKLPSKNNRRTLLQKMSTIFGVLFLEACSSKTKKIESVSVAFPHQVLKKTTTSIIDNGPIDRTFGEVAPYKFSGDDSEHAHQILWDIPNYIQSIGGKIPEITERVPIVVIGGGMSGLFSAFRLKRYLPIVLERAERFGGNNRGESWRGIDYSLNGTQVKTPKEESGLYELLKELELNRMLNSNQENISVIYNGKVFQHLLKGDIDPSAAKQGATLELYFSDLLENKNGRIFPEIPPQNQAQIEIIKELDKKTLKEHLKIILAVEIIHPHLEMWIEHICWTTCGGSYREISAAVGVNQLSREFGKKLVLQGGTSLIAEQLLNKLKKTIGSDRLRSGALVFQVKSTAEGVLVTYEQNGQNKTILAESVVMACPKYVVAKIFQNIEPEREKVIRRIRYNSQLIANILLNRKISFSFNKLNIFNSIKINLKELQAIAEADQTILLFNGTFARESQKGGILTLVRPFPYQLGTSQLYSTGAYLKYRKEIVNQVETEILPTLGVPSSDIAGVRLARWGHTTPVALPGFLSSGLIEISHKPFANNVYFVNKDNWLNPCIESSYAEANKWAPQLVQALEERRIAKQKELGPKL